jgi:hypothetical protein
MTTNAGKQILIFNSGFAPEEIKGKPKSIRVERRDLKSPIDSPTEIACLQEMTNYRPDGKKAERSTYRPDGTLSYRELYEYASDGRLTTLITFDGAGTMVQKTHIIRSAETGIEEQVVTDATGKELTRTVSTQDNNNPRGLASRVDVIRTGDVLVITTYGADGTILTRIEMREGNDRRELSLMFRQNPAAQVTTIEQCDTRDVEGNWTKKTILERYGPTGPMEPVAEIYRRIIY